MAYLLDANAFIAPNRGPYGFNLCPGFWDWLDQAMSSGVVASVQAVLDELVAGDDDLAEWALARQQFFRRPTEETVRATAALHRWADASTHYNERAKAEFSEVADARLIAAAQVDGDIVVTLERPGNDIGKIRIPNAAATVDVRVMSPYTMLHTESARFVLEGGQ